MPFLLGRPQVSMILEIILLAIAIYAILRFLGSTRGGGVLRGMFFFGLFVILLIGVLSRWPGVPVLADILDRKSVV